MGKTETTVLAGPKQDHLQTPEKYQGPDQTVTGPTLSNS